MLCRFSARARLCVFAVVDSQIRKKSKVKYRMVDMLRLIDFSRIIDTTNTICLLCMHACFYIYMKLRPEVTRTLKSDYYN